MINQLVVAPAGVLVLALACQGVRLGVKLRVGLSQMMKGEG